MKNNNKRSLTFEEELERLAQIRRKLNISTLIFSVFSLLASIVALIVHFFR